MFADRNVTYEDLSKDKGLNIKEDEYVMQVADNALSLEIALSHKTSILKCQELQELHQLMGSGLDKHAGIIDGNRHLPFFDESGKRNMADGDRLKNELKLLDKQTALLMKKAGDNPEEKIKAVCTQAMRLFAIHPFNDGNKRIVKMLLCNFMEKEFKLHAHQRPKWTEIPRKIINQAVRGNNIGPFARKVCELYDIKYDPQKITDFEISSYKIFPDTGRKTFSIKEELKRSALRKGNKVSYTEPVITRAELKALGIESKGLFRKNPVCEDLLSSSSTDALLRKTKSYFARGQISEKQAQELTNKAILIIDGAEEKSCKLATTKFLNTEMNDVRKAVRFYEKEDFEISTEKIPDNSLSLIDDISSQIQQTEKTVRIR